MTQPISDGQSRETLGHPRRADMYVFSLESYFEVFTMRLCTLSCLVVSRHPPVLNAAIFQSVSVKTLGTLPDGFA